jgi:hypothetical protein
MDQKQASIPTFRSDRPRPAVWYYTLQYNRWLNPRGVGWSWTPKGATAVYDFTVWKDGTRVAAWSGTESDAFNAMLDFAARDEREAGLRQFLRGEAVPVDLAKVAAPPPSPATGKES